MWIFIAILFGTLFSFWISAICGGGASMVLIPILSLILPPTHIASALTVGTLSSSVSRLYVFRKYIKWRIVKYYVPAAIPLVWLGVWALKYVNPIYLQFFIGLFLLLNIKQLLKRAGKNKNEKKPIKSPFLLSIIGGIAGFVSGVTGATGVLFNRFYLNYGMTKEEIIATRAANDILLHIIKLGLYITMGLFNLKVLKVGGLIALGAILSSVTISFILPYISEKVFKKIGYIAMALSGLLLVINTSVVILEKDKLSIKFSNQGDNFETLFYWRNQRVAFEYANGESLEMELLIPFEEIPVRLYPEILKLTKNAVDVYYEKVNHSSGVYYEIHYTKNNCIYKKKLR